MGRAFKYLCALLLPLTAVISFTSTGLLSFSTLIFAFIFIPVTELLINTDEENLSKEEEGVVKNQKVYDWILYTTVFVQYVFLVFFLIQVRNPELGTLDVVGRISAMGVLCGTLGINVAHELGHRSTSYERFLSKLLLLTSLYMHFYIEHNRGHHRYVSTDEDPASARFGETVYAFYFRSIFGAWFSAWNIEASQLKKAGRKVVSLENEMIRFQMIQLLFIVLIGLVFGWTTMLYFVLAAITGFIYLETVNYIEHYGLRREKVGDHYERVKTEHSWNSNHRLGRAVLFELSRHSDHHYSASRKYQILRHHDNSPQMPTGYPGMMLLSLIPPLWFKVMNKRVKAYQGGH